jgi:outer membrane lipoprotein-sorting protein
MKNLSVVFIILMLFALGCRMPRFLEVGNTEAPSDNASEGTEVAATENPATVPTDDPRSDVIRTSKKFLDRQNFSATMDGEGKTPMRIQLDYQHPDRFHMTYRQPGGEVQTETIIIGRDMYMRVGQNWQKMPGALGKTVPQIRELFDEKGLETLTDVEYVGEDPVKGERAYLYRYSNEAGKGGSPHPFTSQIWVRASDGLPAKIEVDYEGGDLRTLTIVYDYDKPVSIEPPIGK